VSPALLAVALCAATLAGAPAPASTSTPATPPSPADPATAAPLPDADPIGFHARADKARVKLGEPFGYQIEIRHAPDEWYVLRGEPALAPFRAQGVRCRRDARRGEVLTTCTMQLALFALGDVDVPDLVFEVDRPAGKARLVVPGPRVTGLGMLDPAAPPEAIPLRAAPPAPLLVRSFRLLWWTLGALALAALLAAAAVTASRWWGRRGAVATPALSPAERFERRLQALGTERLVEQGRGEEHVTRLSEAVRDYLASVTGQPALDLTTAELLAALATAPDQRLDLAGLELFLGGADRVKFARQPAGPAQCAAGLEYAWDLLQRTRPPAGGPP
jgi:hypothetical protein